MSLVQNGPEILPYIDTPPSPAALAAAHASIQAELDGQGAQTALHPSIPPLREPHFSDRMLASHTRLAAGDEARGSGVDLARYHVPSAPSDGGDRAVWTSALRRAGASLEYLRAREVNLALLEVYGKNAWLIGNGQLEDLLRDLDRDLEAAKWEQEEVERARRVAQDDVSGELTRLEESWREGVGRTLETQAAAERVRLEILRRRRESVT